MIKTYKDLIIWKRSMDLVEKIYRNTQNYPKNENFGLVSQMRRSAVSVASNIAEGYGRQSSASYGYFLKIARASLYELETQVEISLRLGYFPKPEGEIVFADITEISKMITSLINKIKNTPLPSSK